MSKTKFLSAVNNIIHDLDIIIDNDLYTADERNIYAIRVFTSNCPICDRKEGVCPESCMLSTNLGCLDHKTFPSGIQKTRKDRMLLRREFWKEVRRVGQCLTEEAFHDLPLVRNIINGIDLSVYNRYYDG